MSNISTFYVKGSPVIKYSFSNTLLDSVLSKGPGYVDKHPKHFTYDESWRCWMFRFTRWIHFSNYWRRSKLQTSSNRMLQAPVWRTPFLTNVIAKLNYCDIFFSFHIIGFCICLLSISLKRLWIIKPTYKVDWIQFQNEISKGQYILENLFETCFTLAYSSIWI